MPFTSASATQLFPQTRTDEWVRIPYFNLHLISVHPTYLPLAKFGFLLDTIYPSCIQDHRQQSSWVPCTRYLYRHLVTYDASSSAARAISSLHLFVFWRFHSSFIPPFIHHALFLLPSVVHTRLLSIVLSPSRSVHALGCSIHPSP